MEMLHLSQLNIGEKFINPRLKMTNIFIFLSAVSRVVFQHAIFLALLISFDCSAEAWALPKAQVLVEQINGYNVEWIGTPMRLEQGGSNRPGDRIVFFPLVATDGKPVAEKQPQTKSDSAVQRDDHGVGEQFKKHGVYWLLIPGFWFLVGLILGGAFRAAPSE